jgi:hypothetical protein
MMSSMTIFPGEIGHKKARMENKPNCVIDPRVITECMVPTFMFPCEVTGPRERGTRQKIFWRKSLSAFWKCLQSSGENRPPRI